jgi:hypothetical protein
MRADLLFFLAVLLFFFILWLGSGGPTHPISFAGPYITPVTNVGVTQVGYGGDGFHASQEEISAGVREDLSDIRSDLNSLIVFGIASPLKDKVRITGVRNAGTEPDREYVTIRNAGSEPVTITGWRVQSAATDRGATIGEGVLLPSQGGGDETSPITLAPGDQAFLITGDSPIDESFKENQCVGYFGSSDKWQPALERSCPTPRAEFDEYYVGNDLKDSSCYQLAQETAQCTVPRTTTRTSSACYAFIDNYLNYRGCVAAHRGDSHFDNHTWRIYLDYRYKKGGEEQPLWKTSREGVKLLDANGKTVDLYQY